MSKKSKRREKWLRNKEARYRSAQLKTSKFARMTEWESEAHIAALDRGLDLTVNQTRMESGSICTFHWMFRDEAGALIMSYWPATGAWYVPRNGAKGKVETWQDALETAVWAAMKAAG